MPTLPRDPRGKLPEAALRGLFEGALHVPVVLPADTPYVRGHFPGAPIVPAAVQLHELVVAAIRRAWPDLGALRGVRRARFQAPVAPGDALTLRLRRTALVVAFEVRRADALCSSGSVEFGEAPA